MEIYFENAKINYSVAGNGKCLVLLHGFLHDSEMWTKYRTRWLQSGYKVLCMDLPGHGKSHVVENLSIETIAEILHTILEKEAIEKVQIIGHSLGGYTGLAFANLFPKKLEKLILYHSSAFADTAEVKKKRDLWLKIIDKHPAMFMKSVLEFLYTKENVLKYQKSIKNDIEKAKAKGKEAYIAIIKAMRDRPENRAILKSGLAIYFVAGKHDKVIPEAVSNEQIAIIKNGSGAVLENTSHMSFVEDANQAFEVLNRFLEA